MTFCFVLFPVAFVLNLINSALLPHHGALATPLTVLGFSNVGGLSGSVLFVLNFINEFNSMTIIINWYNFRLDICLRRELVAFLIIKNVFFVVHTFAVAIFVVVVVITIVVFAFTSGYALVSPSATACSSATALTTH